jgi:hypothetical protein
MSVSSATDSPAPEVGTTHAATMEAPMEAAASKTATTTASERIIGN